MEKRYHYNFFAPQEKNEKKMNITNIFCCFYVFLQWWVGMDVIHTPDSAGYIHFSPSRTAGYPLFLSAFKLLTGSFAWLPHIQIALVWASIGYVSRGLPRYLRLPWLLGMIAVCFITKQCYCLEIMTEPLVMTLFMVWAGLMLHRHSILGVGLCVGGLILLRPVAYAVLPAYLFYVWAQKESWIKSFIPLIGCFALGVGAQAIQNNIWSTQSFLGHNLIGKVAFVIKPDMQGSTADQTLFIQRMATYMGPIQQALADVPSEPIRYYLSAPIYDVIRYGKLTSFHEDLLVDVAQHDIFWKNTALEIIKQNPAAYIKDVWMNWQALWFMWDLLPEEQRVIRTHYAEKVSCNIPDFKFERFEQKSRYAIFVYIFRSIVFFVIILSLAHFIYIKWWRRYSLSAQQVTLLIISLALHGIFLLTAMLQAGLPRYALVLWPYFGLILLLSIGIFYEKYRCSHPVL